MQQIAAALRFKPWQRNLPEMPREAGREVEHCLQKTALEQKERAHAEERRIQRRHGRGPPRQRADEDTQTQAHHIAGHEQLEIPPPAFWT